RRPADDEDCRDSAGQRLRDSREPREIQRRVKDATPYAVAARSTRADVGWCTAIGSSSENAASSSLTLRKYCCLTWNGKNALLKPLKMHCLMSFRVIPICVWQSQSSLLTVVSVIRRLSVLTVTRRPRFL